jgi:tetratricopeptide (TPR) repeat protein
VKHGELSFEKKPSNAPKIDAKRIINTSNSFLKEREPEMNAEEYALYEKIAEMSANQPEFALKLLEAMMSDTQPPSPAFEFILGNVYFAAGQMDKAKARYLSAVKRYPSFVRGWSNLGVLYYSADDYAEAKGCFSKAITLGDHDPETLGLLGYCLERTGNNVAAEMAYMQALSGSPDNTEWMEGLLRIYVQGRQFGRAESLVKSLIDLKPDRKELWLTYANILISDNRKLEAMIVLEASVGAGVAGPDELNLLGDLYAEQGFNSEAADIYQQIMASSPEIGERKFLYFAHVLISTHRLQQAGELLGRLKTGLTPAGRPDYLLACADLAAAKQQWPQARGFFQEILAASPLNGKALLGLGQAYAAEDDPTHATFAFESAYQIPDSAYRASLELANLELKARHYDKCAEYLEKALSMEKTDAVADYLARVKTLAEKTAD